MQNSKIKSFSDLRAWQEGHRLALLVYSSTKEFPQAEIYALTDQMRRAAVSVTSNIAEGFSRKSAKEKIQFYRMGLGSLSELHNQLIISKDLGYLNEIKFTEAVQLSELVSKLTNGLIKFLRS